VPLTVELLDSADRVGWDRFVEAHPRATIYHTTWWQDIVRSVFGHRPRHLVAREPTGELGGILPLFEIRGAGRPRLVSSPLRDRGGALGDPPSCRALARAARQLAEDLACSYVMLKQEDPSPELDGERYIRVDHWVTRVLDLPPEFEKLDPRLRWSVRKAERGGLQWEISSHAQAADRFYDLFIETRRRLGVPTYSRRFFRSLIEQPSRAQFCLVSRDGLDLAGIVLLLHGRQVISGYAANSAAGRSLRASDFGYWQAIRWSAEHGYRIFDFGSDSPHQDGVRQFKEKWDGREVPLSHYYYLHRARHVPLQDSSRGLWRLARKPWSWLPRPLFEQLSTWAVRYVD
jgi:FemAB-related protein (PEP-CTERM system-associated)